MHVLVLNCGSSSLKYRLFDMARSGDDALLAVGSVERIGHDGVVLHHRRGDEVRGVPLEASDHAAAVTRLHAVLVEEGLADDIGAVGHRVVHGGEYYAEAEVITIEIEAGIEHLAALAPLHNPANLAGIRAAKAAFPDLEHVAVFDTAFHQTMPPHAHLYAIPMSYYHTHDIRRFGFHGTSHRYVSERAAVMVESESGWFTGVTCHLGNGCSIAAIDRGRCIDTSMGFTPLEGLMMGTRSGDIDPSVLIYMQSALGMSADDIDRVLNRESGLLGVSGISNDMREVEHAAKNGNPQAELAVAMFVHRVKKYIGAYTALLRDASAVVFTGGIGENSPYIRARIMSRMHHLGYEMDFDRNETCIGACEDISASATERGVLVIPTDEERLIAEETWRLVSGP